MRKKILLSNTLYAISKAILRFIRCWKIRYFIKDIRSQNQICIQEIGRNQRFILSAEQILADKNIFHCLSKEDRNYLEEVIKLA